MTVLCLAFSVPLSAKTIVDSYGLDDKTSADIVRKYGKEVSHVESLMVDALKKSTQDQKNLNINDLITKRTALIETIKKTYGLVYVDFGTTIYPDTQSAYTTIEGVTEQQKQRLRFIVAKRPMVELVVNEKNKKDVVDDMIIYEDIALPLILKNEVGHKNQPCPVYHCISGFDDARLKPYLNRFNTGVIKEKKRILTTLSNKKSHSRRRVAAVYLMGHFQDPHEILKTLLHYVNDPDANVRNAAMRVIGRTMQKANITDMDVTPFLESLDSPILTDRNKALYVLFSASESMPVKKQILEKGKDHLLALLKLKQPNNHEFAYLILKKISGKDFGETNIAAWERWRSSERQAVI